MVAKCEWEDVRVRVPWGPLLSYETKREWYMNWRCAESGVRIESVWTRIRLSMFLRAARNERLRRLENRRK